MSSSSFKDLSHADLVCILEVIQFAQPQAVTTAVTLVKVSSKLQTMEDDTGVDIELPSWCNYADQRPQRCEIVEYIYDLLKPNDTALYVAHRLEFDLYCSAPSLEAYLDRSTLDDRLKQAALVVKRERDQGILHQAVEVSDSSTTGSNGHTRKSIFIEKLEEEIQKLPSDYENKGKLQDMVDATKVLCKKINGGTKHSGKKKFTRALLSLTKANPNVDIRTQMKDLIATAKKICKRDKPRRRRDKSRRNRKQKAATEATIDVAA